jgi:phosphatidylserine/phosphatidylglycerophosphate/cardiolipin synthase-like enzyme
VGSANMNYRSLDDDKDFECCVLVDDARFAADLNKNVRDYDIAHAHKITADDLTFRANNREPLTIILEELREI